MQITEIKKSLRGNKFHIYLDGEYRFSVEESTIVKENLYKGKVLEETDLSRIKKSDKLSSFLAKTLALLAVRPRSKKEIERYLTSKLRLTADLLKEEKQEVAATIMERLEELGYVNDEDFARILLRSKLHKLKSPAEIRSALANKGIAKDLVEKLLKEEIAESVQEDLLKELIAKKNKIYKMYSSDELKAKQKLRQYLLRKGFNWELIRDLT